MLYRKLEQYNKTDWYPFHMPGHKRNGAALEAGKLPYEIDITEITGFDDLHHASGILKTCMEWAAKQYQTERTYFLVNGSTCGIQAAVSAAANPGDTIIAARNCHKSVYNTIFLRQLNPVYLYPEQLTELGINGAIQAAQVSEALSQYPQAKAVVIVSPTYDGIVSDIAAISEICHRHRVPLIVDEAHGAHFPYSRYFPESAIAQGADAVIHSIHKTLPALTQTALLHCQGDILAYKTVEKFLGIYQSSSPSYVLMSSIDRGLRYLEKNRETLFTQYAENLEWFYEQVKGLKNLYVCNQKGHDRSKLLISGRNYNRKKESQGKTERISGMWLHEQLQTYHLEMEMAGYDYVLGLTSCMDTRRGLERLAAAVCELDTKLSGQLVPSVGQQPDLYKKQIEWLRLHTDQQAEEHIYVYPPGIPIVAAGEILTRDKAAELAAYAENGLEIHGLV